MISPASAPKINPSPADPSSVISSENEKSNVAGQPIEPQNENRSAMKAWFWRIFQVETRSALLARYGARHQLNTNWTVLETGVDRQERSRISRSDESAGGGSPALSDRRSEGSGLLSS